MRIVTSAAIILGASVMAVQFIDQASRRVVTPDAPTSAAPVSAVQVAPVAPASAAVAVPNQISSHRLVIRAGEGGHFAVDGNVDGRLITFLVDTGASQIALRASDAERLGFFMRPRDYSIKVATANGVGRAALLQLGKVQVGSIVVRDVPALVTPDDALAVNLLGMSFLSRVRWSHEDGNLVIEQ
jgi:aspartyl protease family protein